MTNQKPTRLIQFAWFVLVYNIGVILWGAYVRATGSGAGCGNHWPLCNGEVFPRAKEIETLIEFAHRTTSGVALIAVVALSIWVFRAFPKKHIARTGAMLSLFFIIAEALIGAGLVLFKLVAGNTSMMRAAYLSVHLVNTFLLLASLAMTAWWVTGGKAIEWKRSITTVLVSVGIIGLLILGVSGAITALGDTLFPSRSLLEGFNQDMSPTSHILLRLRIWHPIIAIIVGFYAIFSAVLLEQLVKTKAVKRLGQLLIGLVMIQFVAGVINVALLAPIWLQMVHLLLADMLWVTFVLMGTAALSETPTATADSQSVEHIEKGLVGA